MRDASELNPCLECGGEDIAVAPPAIPGQALALVRCRQCGTTVVGDTTEQAVSFWNLPTQTGASDAPLASRQQGLADRRSAILDAKASAVRRSARE
jgi:hypothetical protein